VRRPPPGSSHLLDAFAAYLTRLKTVNQLLRFLVEDEINRLSVWTNPTHDLKRGTDYVGTMERTMTDVREFKVVASHN
jgi:phosphatidylinositol 4-kinase